MNRFFSFSKNYLIKQNVLKKQMELLRSLVKPIKEGSVLAINISRRYTKTEPIKNR